MGLSNNFPCERHSRSGRNPPGGAGDLVPAATCVGLASDPCILASGSRGGNPSNSDGSGRWVDQFWHPRSASRHDPRKILGQAVGDARLTAPAVAAFVGLCHGLLLLAACPHPSWRSHGRAARRRWLVRTTSFRWAGG